MWIGFMIKWFETKSICYLFALKNFYLRDFLKFNIYKQWEFYSNDLVNFKSKMRIISLKN